MQVKIMGQPKEVKVTTVSIELDPLDPMGLNMMHCWRCGEKVTQIIGNVIRIIPGGLPINILEMAPQTIPQCSRCKTRYLINNIV